MDQPGLWRRFAACADASAALAFVEEFGLLSSRKPRMATMAADPFDDDNPFHDAHPSDVVDHVLRMAKLIRQIADLIDGKHYAEAAERWSACARPRITAGLKETNRHGRFEFKPIPLTLDSALWLQTADAIALNQQWRHCRNDDCTNWFQIGDGAHTARREFCSDRCRVAWARHHKQKKATHRQPKKAVAKGGLQ